MKRGGGKAGRPMGLWSVDLLEKLIKRLIDKNRRAMIASIGPLFRGFE